MSTVQAAKVAARKAVESTYDGIAIVEEYRQVKDEVTKLASGKPVIVLENQPCRLSFERLQIVNQTQSAATVTQTTKLFISPDVIIKPGSKITVTQAGKTAEYTYSGVPAVYDTHQEIVLDLFTRWT